MIELIETWWDYCVQLFLQWVYFVPNLVAAQDTSRGNLC